MAKATMFAHLMASSVFFLSTSGSHGASWFGPATCPVLSSWPWLVATVGAAMDTNSLLPAYTDVGNVVGPDPGALCKPPETSTVEAGRLHRPGACQELGQAPADLPVLPVER